MMRSLLVALALSLAAAACQNDGADPRRADSRDAMRSARVDALFERYDAEKGPGCAIGIVDRGRAVHSRGYGYANLDYDIHLTPDSVFRIASVSKQFTAAAIALAAEDGLLDLDDPVGRHLPELLPEMHPVTIRQLLGHTGGVPDYGGKGWEGLLKSSAGGPFRYGNEDYLSTEEFFEITTKLRPLYPPGEQYQYSNIGYFWMSQIVERATGESLRDYAQQRIFDPVGMDSTFFNDDVNTIVPNRATGYAPRPGGGYEVFETNLDWIGDGGVYTTINDFFRWDAQFDRPTIGANPVALRELLISPIGDEESWETDRIRHALGLWLSPEEADELVIWHPGSWVAFTTLYRRFPERDFAYFVFCNRPDVDRRRLATQIEAIYAPK